MRIFFLHVHHNTMTKLQYQNVWQYASVSCLPHTGDMMHQCLWFTENCCCQEASLSLLWPLTCIQHVTCLLPPQGASYSQGENTWHDERTITQTYSRWQELHDSASPLLSLHCILTDEFMSESILKLERWDVALGVDTVTPDSKASLSLYGALFIHMFRGTQVFMRQSSSGVKYIYSSIVPTFT